MGLCHHLAMALASGTILTAAACSLVVDTDGFTCDAANGLCVSGEDAASRGDTGADTGTDGRVDKDATVGPDPDSAPADAASPSGYRAAVLADEPVAYYRLGDRSGASAKDERGMADGTYVNPMLGEPALIQDDDTAARFEGSGVVPVGNILDVSGTKSFSIELWLRPSVVDDVYRYAFFKEGSPGPGRRGVAVFSHAGALDLERYVGGTGVFVTVGGVTTSSIYHVVGTYDGSTLRLYANGVLADSHPDARPIGLSVDEPAYIGANNSGLTNPFRGTLDEVAVYDKALAEARVRLHYQLGHR